MTEVEKNPATKTRKRQPGLWCILGMFFVLASLVQFSSSEGFLKGLESYFWKQTEGTIVSNDLRFHKNSGSGTVTYAAMIDGREITRTDEVFERWSWDKQKKYDDWPAAYAVGESVRIFYAADGRTSVGHWPTEYSLKGFSGLGNLCLGLYFVLHGLRMRKADKALAATAAAPGG